MARIVNLRQQTAPQKQDAPQAPLRPRPFMRQRPAVYQPQRPDPAPLPPPQEALPIQEQLQDQNLLSWNVPAQISGPRTYLLPGGLSAGAVASWLALGDPTLVALCGVAAASTFLVSRGDARLSVELSDTALILGSRIVPYTSLAGFWVHYVPGGEKELIFHPKQWYAPLLVIPLGDADPVAVRGFLAEKLIEKEVTPSLSAAIAKRLGW
ncbi:MAG: hypothetical protein AAB608_02970 [Patescibacteria group bacterium]